MNQNNVTFNALILGGGSRDSVDGLEGPKGLVDILGRPMLEWVIDALVEAESVDNIALVFPDMDLLSDDIKSKVDILVESNGEFSDNVLRGLDALGNEKQVLAVTGDIPALTAEAIDDLVGRTLESKADFAYAVIRDSDIESQFPGSARTYLKLKDGRITGGNIIVIGPQSLHGVREHIQVFFEARKNPMSLAQILGLSFMARFAMGQLSFADLEKKMGGIVKAPCKALLTPYASIGADVDKPIDKVVVEKVLSAR